MFSIIPSNQLISAKILVTGYDMDCKISVLNKFLNFSKNHAFVCIDFCETTKLHYHLSKLFYSVEIVTAEDGINSVFDDITNVKSLSDYFYRVCGDEMKARQVSNMLLLLDEICKMLKNGGRLDKESYIQLSDPQGFEEAMNFLEMHGVNTYNLRARYIRGAVCFNDLDDLFYSSVGKKNIVLKPGHAVYIHPESSGDLVNNTDLVRHLNNIFASANAYHVSLLINESNHCHGKLLCPLLRSIADRSNISALYITNNIFSTEIYDDIIPLFETVIYSRCNAEAAKKLSERFGQRVIPVKSTSTIRDKRLSAYSIWDRILRTDRTESITYTPQMMPVLDPQQMLRLSPGTALITSGSEFAIGSIARYLI